MIFSPPAGSNQGMSEKPPRSGSGEKESCSAGKDGLFKKTDLWPGGKKEGACQRKKEGYVCP
jgi:hypothetical protein